MSGNYHTINSEQSLYDFIKKLRGDWEKCKWLQVQVTNEKQRSQLQNNSLHMWCPIMAELLNNNNLDMREVVNRVMTRPEVPWTGGSVKESIWRPVQYAITGKESTTQASTKEYPIIYEAIAKAFGQRVGLQVPAWPSKDLKGVS